MPVKMMLPVTAAPETVKLGPIVLISGFMTKKSRSLKRWKQRWWQLMDNGFLHYFKSDDHPQKLLGKIDVGKTCYEVKLGAEICHVKFPRAIPTCCCFCFAVLKRTYYVYTPTPDEAQNWAQAINDMSKVINRKVVVGLERIKASLIPDVHGNFSGNMKVSVTRERLKGSQGNLSDSCQDISQVNYIPIKKNNLVASKTAMASSVPSYLDTMGNQERESPMSSYVSEMLQEQQPEIVTLEEMQASRNGRHHLSPPCSVIRENALSEHIQQVAQQHQKQQINKQQKQRSNSINRSFSLEDICSPQPYCHQPVCPTQLKPVPKPRKAKNTSNSVDKEKNFLECHAQRTSDTKMKPAPPFSSPPPLHPPPTSQYTLPRQKKKTSAYHFSPPSSPPPPPPSQQNACESTLSLLTLSSPPPSRPKKNIGALSTSMTPYHPAKPFLPPRPITETDIFSSPPLPRKKTMTHMPGTLLALSSPPSSRPKKNIGALSTSMTPHHPAKPFLPPRPITETEIFSSPPLPRKKTMTHMPETLLALSSPPSSRPKKNIGALSTSMTPHHPAKPFLTPRPITETETTPFSSPPLPRKKTMTHMPGTHLDSGFTDKPKLKPRINHS